MGYTTDFDGIVSIQPPLNSDEVSFLKDLAETRRMERQKGPLFVKGTGDFGQGQDSDIRNYNAPDASQPGLWLQWVPSFDGTHLTWDGNEKFYHAEDWMAYLIMLLSPKGKSYVKKSVAQDERLKKFTCDHTLNGVIHAQGEYSDDSWSLVVVDNNVTRQPR
jgi:hypothetical protein